MTARAVHVLISGRVQGVWYRGWTCDRAEVLGLDGWVRNRSDGRVEAVFSGSAEAVEQALADCREGPRLASVAEVSVAPWEGPVEAGFRQLPSA